MFADLNIVSAILILIVIVSCLYGMFRGASGSARHLFFFIVSGASALISIALAAYLARSLSPLAQRWLTAREIVVPDRALRVWEQFYYTLVTALRDFSLLRFAVIFILLYLLIRMILDMFGNWGAHRFSPEPTADAAQRAGLFSRVIGALIGTVIGAGRSIMAIALLFVVVSLYPQLWISDYIKESSVYSRGAALVVEPLTGRWMKEQLPVLTKAAEQEFQAVLQRKYEVIDHAIPDDIALAAGSVTDGAKSDEQKARRLYDWVGTRIRYDWDKVRAYEERGEWKEQTPQHTFDSREGVCIDYARLYAVMARSVGLQVKVVTGLGYDGNGGFGAHAWNEVYLSERNEWVPLDPTWAGAGDWFDPPGFYDTHRKDAYYSTLDSA
ncbi:transglutaminase domain-containing protein [Paenibacillus sp. MSJ-34]|uniref:transglutaminase domain-containing protein n=1 Tax=Paenibacillus sp. MSJ-34 TaxID=2841529 RepID=UPI001C1200EE|nr:transglutaminase domain-containing protein [Paenibacillus sp. MSJ-34]MBU5441452.1 transglutaminase domain-containing protein [Paenibacillus sp. MSJ-34]